MRALSILAASALALGAAATSADAACKRFGFTVNDYGKEGPTNDAKALLDKHVSEWASKSGVSDYRIGKKSVKCELFLDFVVFDEYTCTASANVCWGQDISKIEPGEDPVSDGEHPPSPVSKVAAGLERKAPAETASTDAEESAAPETASAIDEMKPDAPDAMDAQDEDQGGVFKVPPTETAAVTAPDADEAPAVSVTGSPVVETGALGNDAAPAAPASSDDEMAATGEDEDGAAAASSAAAAAAAAAERAAAAAQTAAAAAKEAAAAAVAASAANRGVIVPPIDNGR